MYVFIMQSKGYEWLYYVYIDMPYILSVMTSDSETQNQSSAVHRALVCKKEKNYFHIKYIFIEY